MITHIQMYWLLKLDDICGFSIVVLTVALLVFLFSTIGKLTFCDNDLYDTKSITKTRNIALCVALFFGAIAIFLPSTKQMAAIITIPAIVNNQKVQEIGNKTLDISNDLLSLTQQYINKQLNNGGSKND